MMQALYEQSKGVMSPSPDMRSVQPPHVLSSNKKNQHRIGLYYSLGKDSGVPRS